MVLDGFEVDADEEQEVLVNEKFDSRESGLRGLESQIKATGQVAIFAYKRVNKEASRQPADYLETEVSKVSTSKTKLPGILQPTQCCTSCMQRDDRGSR